MAFEVNLPIKGDVTVAIWFTDHFSEARHGTAGGTAVAPPLLRSAGAGLFVSKDGLDPTPTTPTTPTRPTTPRLVCSGTPRPCLTPSTPPLLTAPPEEC